MALRKRLRLRKPHAARLILCTFELTDSLAALVARRAMALTMPQRWSRIMRATFSMGSSRLRMALPIHAVQAARALLRRTNRQMHIAVSFSDQARLVRRFI